MPAPLSVLVTGATGLVGSHLVEKLLAQPDTYRVRVLVRPSSDLSFLQGKAAVEKVLGDLSDPSTLPAAVQGVKIVFHCAAFVSDWASREEMVRINVTGLRHLLEASEAAGVERFILVSSMAVLGMGKQDNLDESAPYVVTGDLYNYTKIEAEKLGLEFARHNKGMAVTVLRPPYIYGPRDRQMLPRILSVLKEGKFSYIKEGSNPFHLVFVDNLVQVMLLAAKNPRSAGQIYHVTDGVSITRKEFIEFICERLDFPRPKKSVPLPVAKVACGLMEAMAKISKSKKPPLLNKFRLKFMSTYLTFSIDKAKRELGYSPEPQKDCLAATLDWYKSQSKA